MDEIGEGFVIDGICADQKKALVERALFG